MFEVMNLIVGMVLVVEVAVPVTMELISGLF